MTHEYTHEARPQRERGRKVFLELPQETFFKNKKKGKACDNAVHTP